MLSGITSFSLSAGNQALDLNSNRQLNRSGELGANRSSLAAQAQAGRVGSDDAVRVTLSRNFGADLRTRDIQVEREHQELVTYKPTRKPNSDGDKEERFEVNSDFIFESPIDGTEHKGQGESKADVTDSAFFDATGSSGKELTIGEDTPLF